ncbi:GTPase Era [Alicyclobacillus tolerans]|uniref:GTPase Era n=1 Tax=Alicyclobacillus tolerans TaxID=90970 RepID=A0A1M6JW44_9BACL|nr:GTPase Era [Alicyclobacillus montanus]SHJ50910.1 GTP-binding protein Era [Alicyclobacillus montanus]
MAQEHPAFRSGFVAIVGRPNVGKSTLLNQLVGRKVAIMSNRPQTTRHQIRGVVTTDSGQMIFIDTPGIHKPKHRLGEAMVETALAALREVDVVLFVADITSSQIDQDRQILQRMKDLTTPVFLVLNKIDAEEKGKILSKIEQYQSLYPFAEHIPVSAKRGTQLNVLTEQIMFVLPEGPKYYPDHMVTDHPESFLIEEMIREKVIHLTREEIPHSVAVVLEQMEQRPRGTLYVQAVIYTERDSQKGILIGKQGAMLKKVGELARAELERLLGNKMYLELWVKVKKDWRNDDSVLRRFGFENLS